MMRVARVLLISAIATLGVVTPVFAAAPGNDLYAGRTAIATTPFGDSIDTTEATTDGDDAEANAQCGAPATDASVWYEYTPAADGGVVVETYDSDYPVGIIVATGSPGSFSVITCSGGAVGFGTTAGETYAILLFDYQGDGGGNGGSLVLSVRDVPPPPVLDLTIASAGSFNAITGAAIIRGTVTCTGGGEGEKAFIDVQVVQNVGRFRIHGQGGTTFECDGTTRAWSAEVFGDNGKFGGGKASVQLFAFVCNEGGCDDFEATASVTLRR